MIKVGQVVPEFELPDGAGTLHSFQYGAVTVVYFTSNRCPASFAWQPRVADVAAEYASTVTFLAINVPCQFPGPVAAKMPMRDGEEGVQAVATEPTWKGITYLCGETLEVARRYGALIVPDFFVLDTNGVLRYRGAPDDSQFEPERRAIWLRDALDATLDDRPVPFVPEALNGCPIKYKGNDDLMSDSGAGSV